MNMSDDATRAVKFNVKTGDVARRTIFDDDITTPCTSWLIASAGRGSLYVTEAQVSGPDWVDLELPHQDLVEG